MFHPPSVNTNIDPLCLYLLYLRLIFSEVGVERRLNTNL